MSMELIRWVVVILPPILLAGLALWIRPPWKILGFSLIAGLVMGTLNLLGDILAHDQGWWYYPFTTETHAPLAFYLATLFFYGAGIMGLVGWWARKRFGRRGAIVLLMAFPFWGILRDFGSTTFIHQVQGMIVWGKGLTPVVADFLLWGLAGAAGFFTLVGLEKLWERVAGRAVHPSSP